MLTLVSRSALLRSGGASSARRAFSSGSSNMAFRPTQAVQLAFRASTPNPIATPILVAGFGLVGAGIAAQTASEQLRQRHGSFGRQVDQGRIPGQDGQEGGGADPRLARDCPDKGKGQGGAQANDDCKPP
ncbi:hypothetical protein L7F22_045510 [Adiantum nelumboides]|nr:hypothetical protein [Adiantum nelumboides]